MLIDQGKTNIYKIHEIRVLDENDIEAKNALIIAAREVEPLMKKRKWSIKTLQEFSPEDDQFIGLHNGYESLIKLQLRNRNSKELLFHYDFIVGSLLHELAHIQYASHGRRFNTLLKKLRDEYNELYSSKTKKHYNSIVEFFNEDQASIKGDYCVTVNKENQEGISILAVPSFIPKGKTCDKKAAGSSNNSNSNNASSFLSEETAPFNTKTNAKVVIKSGIKDHTETITCVDITDNAKSIVKLDTENVAYVVTADNNRKKRKLDCVPEAENNIDAEVSALNDFNIKTGTKAFPRGSTKRNADIRQTESYNENKRIRCSISEAQIVMIN